MRYLYFVVYACLLYLGSRAFAQDKVSTEEPNPDNTQQENHDHSEYDGFWGLPVEPYRIIRDGLTEFVDYNYANNSRQGFSPHKPNYFLPLNHGTYTEDRKKNEVKFQISVKQRFWRFYGWAWFVGYTQKSFWQAYDLDESRPFRENNFNPETFIRTRMWGGFRMDAGFEHESNGQTEPASHSWNRLYMIPYYENKYCIVSAKLWYRLPEQAKKYPEDPEGDENPDIHRYYGHGELNIALKWRRLRLSGMMRGNPASRHGAARIDLTAPLYTNSMYWYIQYWEGYGESLIDYNIYQRAVGVGVMLTR